MVSARTAVRSLRSFKLCSFPPGPQVSFLRRRSVPAGPKQAHRQAHASLHSSCRCHLAMLITHSSPVAKEPQVEPRVHCMLVAPGKSSGGRRPCHFAFCPPVGWVSPRLVLIATCAGLFICKLIFLLLTSCKSTRTHTVSPRKIFSTHRLTARRVMAGFTFV